jgi:cyclopropane-fatty-acyl-phospholipid synthase
MHPGEQAVGQKRRRRLITRTLIAMAKRSARAMLRWEPIGSLVIELPDGDVLRYGHAGNFAEARLKFNNYRMIAKILTRGPIGFAEAYIAGDFNCPDLTALFRFIVRNRDCIELKAKSLFGIRSDDRVAHRVRRNSRRGSRRNISAHYDLGNEFFRHWLDPDMNYSSGIYANPEHTLEDSQRTKLDRVIGTLDLSGGEKILEIGCGWGALARAAADGFNAHVTGITLSSEQLVHAQKSADRAGLTDRCAFYLKDYRDVRGEYDRIMSIEMIEAVGERYWPGFFGQLHDRLRPGGLAVIQAITIDERRFDAYRKNPDFIQSYIFPGGMLPTPTIIADQAAAAGLQLDDSMRFGQSYAQTLREWRRRFETAWPQISQLGFDDRFHRMWRYYLTYCEAAFLEGVIDVGIYRLRKPDKPD